MHLVFRSSGFLLQGNRTDLPTGGFKKTPTLTLQGPAQMPFPVLSGVRGQGIPLFNNNIPELYLVLPYLALGGS